MRRVLGLVLAGGASRRFGSDKALADHAGRPLVVHAQKALAPHTAAVLLAGRPYFDTAFVADRPEPGLGPLGGLNGGLHHAVANGFTHVLSLACDTPFVPANLLARLAAHPGPCAVADHPVIGLWPASLAPLLDLFLIEDERRSMRGWIARCGADTIAGEGIANINRPADLDGVGRERM